MTDAPTPEVLPEAERPRRTRVRLLDASCILTMLGLLVSLVHFIKSTPLTFSLFMTVGQGAFALAMLLYVVSVVWDLRRRRIL